MNQEQAKKLIKDTFEHAFDKARFIIFIKNLLNSIDESKAFHAHGYVKESFQNIIKTYERIGSYESPDGKKIDIIIVYLQKEFSVNHARVTQRNFAGKYLSDRGEKDAGLFAFVAPNEADWRFSLVKMDYDFKKTPDGKLKVVTEFSPARRWSFLVGENEQSHTAQSQLVKLIVDDEHNPALTQLEEAFNIEKVTNEFFLEYRNLFIRTKEALDEVVEKNPSLKSEFEAKGVNTVDFAKKLLGQIIFLYFLQKKGWFGVGRDDNWGTGSKKFLRELFEKRHSNYNNFFNDILEPLFYEALRIDRSHDDDYYSRFNCKIPFLNGGLFDPIGNYDWVHIDINLPDDLFSNNVLMKVGDTGNGILDIFDRYNFTVREDEPLEKEVAIDPELLGKTYEKFNAIRPDNFEEYKKVLKSGEKGSENKFNKQYGVYYTPREIVHYMCQQSLIHYLETELNGKTVSYERVGKSNLDMFGNKIRKGQLDITIEHKDLPTIPKEEIETFIQLGEQFRENDEIALKKEEQINNGSQNSSSIKTLLPTNIRKNALLIDEKLANITICDPAVGSGAFPVGMMNEIVKARTVLTPYIQDEFRSAYNFKRQCIEKSLYGVDIDSGAVEIAKLRLWLSLIVEEEDFKEIKPLPNLDYKIVCGNSLLGVERNLFNDNLFAELERLKPLYFRETNPKNKDSYKSQIDDLISSLTNGNKDFDFEIYFSEVFHKKGGFDVVIANPPYGANIDNMTKVYAKIYPNTTKAYTDIYKIFIELGIFKVLTADGILCYIIPNTLLLQPRYKDVRQFLLQYKIMEIINLGEEVFEQVVVPTCVIFVQKNKKINAAVKFIDLTDKSKFRGNFNVIDYKIIDQNRYRENSGNIFVSETRYLKSGEVYLDKIMDFKDAGINYQRVKVGLSTKGMSDLSKRLLYEGEKENNEDIEYWKGADIDAYFIAPKTSRFVRIKTISKLKPNERVILNKTYFELTPKIIWRQTAEYPIATIDNRGIWFGRSIQAGRIKLEYDAEIDYKYLLSLLNSRYLRYLYIQNVKESGRVFPQVKLEKLKKLPIREIPLDEQKSLIELVNKILAVTKYDDYPGNPTKQAKVHDYENQIDQLVYKLYNLNDKEIKIIEKN